VELLVATTLGFTAFTFGIGLGGRFSAAFGFTALAFGIGFGLGITAALGLTAFGFSQFGIAAAQGLGSEGVIGRYGGGGTEAKQKCGAYSGDGRFGVIGHDDFLV